MEWPKELDRSRNPRTWLGS